MLVHSSCFGESHTIPEAATLGLARRALPHPCLLKPWYFGKRPTCPVPLIHAMYSPLTFPALQSDRPFLPGSGRMRPLLGVVWLILFFFFLQRLPLSFPSANGPIVPDPLTFLQPIRGVLSFRDRVRRFRPFPFAPSTNKFSNLLGPSTPVP